MTIPNIQDGMDEADTKALYSLAVEIAHKGVVIIEVGSWKGHSASILGDLVKNCQGHLFCVDHWKGSPGVRHHEMETDCLTTFRQNMKTLDLSEVTHPIVMESALATTIIRDEIADLVFIDADHRYESVREDIELWMPKVKKGGILCGHDCEKQLSKCLPSEQDMIRLHQDTDYCNTTQCHAGVITALYACFTDKYEIKDNSKVWFRKL